MELDLALRAVAAPVAVMAALAWLVAELAGRAARTGPPAGRPATPAWHDRPVLSVLAVLPVAWAVAFQEPSWQEVAVPAVSYQWLGWAAVVSALVASALATVPGARWRRPPRRRHRWSRARW